MQKRKALLLALLAIVLLLPAYFTDVFQVNSIENQCAQFNARLVGKEQDLIQTLEELKQWQEHNKLGLHKDSLNRLFEEEAYSFFIFKDSNLTYWSENTTEILIDELFTNQAYYQTNYAYYRKQVIRGENHTYVGLIQLYRKYAIQNEYLRANFRADFQFPDIIGIGKEPSDFPLAENEDLEEKLYLQIDPEAHAGHQAPLLIILFITGILLLFHSLSTFITQKKTVKVPLFIFVILVFRFLLFHFAPELFSQSEFFGSDQLAISAFIPSLGDLLLHLLSLFAIIYLLGTLLKKSNNSMLGVLLLILGFYSAYLNIDLVAHCISSSQISFNLNNPFDLSIYSLVALSCFCLHFISTMLLLDSAIRLINYSAHTGRNILIKILPVIAYVFILIRLLELELIFLWIIPVYIVLNLYLSYPGGKKIISALLILIFSAATLAYSINYELEQKQHLKTKFIAQKLAEERDPVAEFLFTEIQAEISKDSILFAQLGDYWENKEVVDNYIFSRHFDSYWNQYFVNFSICNQNDFLYFNDTETSMACYRYFHERIRLEGDMVSSNNLFQLQNLAGRIDYIGEIPLSHDSISYRLYVELSANYFNENEGYPDLLLDENSRANQLDLADYSYAVYNEGKLVFHNGAYNYSLSPKISELAPEEFYSYHTEDHYHTAYKKHENTLIIISAHSFSFIDFFTSFAYLLICFSIIFLISSLLLENFSFYFRPNLSDFSIKIQLYITGSLLIALIFVALGSNYYIEKQYEQKNFNNLRDKLRSIYLELESKIGREELLTNDEGFSNYFSNLLIQFSNVFYTDINFYDLNGRLYSSSRPEVFEKGLLSQRMESNAYRHIIDIKKAEWVQKEKIGELEYLSAYIPFVNYHNEVIGYLNLPYFVRQGKLQEEISNFLISVINIYVLIFVLSLLISLLLINQLSKPLLLIRNQIRKLKIGSSIELIDWKSQDEIGELVKEYNRIAIELNESAEQLAQSERETAWREMAKQVAHEIKNPLTPMKLSIQHLEAASKTNPEDIEERIKKTAETLIQQIETLSNIATAFSTFAQLPNRQLKKLDLIPILNNAINLYASDANIHIATNGIDEAQILADQDHLLRLLNNLMKNAVQAGIEGKAIEIEIALIKEDQHYLLSISDNGIGIPKDKMHKIFEPYFTTKSSGTGLGLAMSKKIVEQIGAEISVQSTQGQRTTFTIHFPIA